MRANVFWPRWALLSGALLATSVCVSRPLRAEPISPGWDFATRAERESAASKFKPRDCELFCYVHWLGGVGVGRGLRLNNPFRLATPLGDTPDSLSLTATSLEVLIGATFGDADGLQHGTSLNASVALSGVPQEVIAPGYLAVFRSTSRLSFRGRLSLPVVVEPDLNLGTELGLGLGFLLWSGVGLYGELVGSLYYGAATDQTSSSLIPLVSLQLGVAFDYETLP